MDEKTRELMAQLQEKLIGASDDHIREIIRETRDEALAEAKAIIKGMMVQAILEHTLGQLAGTKSKAMPAEGKVPPANEASLPPDQAQTNTTESEEQIRQEMEAVRRKIAENERLLSQDKASPIEAEEEQKPPVEGEVGTPREKREAGYGYYVYGIVGDDSGQPIEDLPKEGIDPGCPVYALPYQGIQAIVSRVSLQEFGQEVLEANLEDMKWLEAKVYAHQSVLEKVLASRTLIPMKFCTIYRSESHVQEMLAQHYDDLVKTLAQLGGKQEWGVKVYYDRKIMAQRIGEMSDRVKDLTAEVEEKSSGAAYFLKKKVDGAIAEEVERISDEYTQRSHDCLATHAEEAIINPLQSKEITGKKEEMILNGVYLVAGGQLAAFRAELESLEEEYTNLGFIYEMTGPWPPYNFVSIGFEEDVTDE